LLVFSSKIKWLRESLGFLNRLNIISNLKKWLTYFLIKLSIKYRTFKNIIKCIFYIYIDVYVFVSYAKLKKSLIDKLISNWFII